MRYPCHAASPSKQHTGGNRTDDTKNTNPLQRNADRRLPRFQSLYIMMGPNFLNPAPLSVLLIECLCEKRYLDGKRTYVKIPLRKPNEL